MKQEISTSFWSDTSEVAGGEYPSLEKNHLTDVCVIGGGVSGLTTALLLSREGKKVTLIDSGRIGAGQSIRTTAHLSNALDDRYYNLINVHGLEGARLAAQSHTAAIDQIEEITEKENIECEFARVDGYLFLGPTCPRDLLQKELDAARKVGLPVQWASRSPLQVAGTGRCLRFPDQGQLHAGKYLNGLARAVVKHGGKIFSNTKAISFEGGTNARVKCESGKVIAANAIVVATNVPVNDRLTIHTKQAAYRSYVIGFEIAKQSVPHALYWDTADPYHYVRVATSANPRFDILIVGGEDHKTGQEEEYESCYQRLEAWTKKFFPQAGAARYRWSGQIIEPVDSLAFIGKNPFDADNVFIVSGDSGNGMTHGTIAGMLITDLIMGRRNAWEQLYSPNRINFHTIPKFVSENVNTAIQYDDWILPGEVASVGEITPGSGAIMRHKLEKLAVFKDTRGNLKVLSATCTHLGGVVRWNSAEGTWDCPCHGSRFSTQGEVINGPALQGLRRVSTKKLPENIRPPRPTAHIPYGAIKGERVSSKGDSV